MCVLNTHYVSLVRWRWDIHQCHPLSCRALVTCVAYILGGWSNIFVDEHKIFIKFFKLCISAAIPDDICPPARQQHASGSAKLFNFLFVCFCCCLFTCQTCHSFFFYFVNFLFYNTVQLNYSIKCNYNITFFFTCSFLGVYFQLTNSMILYILFLHFVFNQSVCK